MNVDNFNNFQACSQQSRVLKKRRSGSVCTRYGVTAPPAQTVIVTTETQKTKDQPAKMWREYRYFVNICNKIIISLKP
ncbi:uncharacterized protein LOC144432088 isoform X3 [Styela clava]